MAKRILVTGTSGFIGRHLFHTLREQGNEVWGMDSKQGESTTNRTLLQHFVGRFQPDVIAHLGANCSTAVSLRDPTKDFQENVVGTFNVCEVARQSGNIPVLFTSTCKVKPGADGKISPLGASKRVAEEYLNMYQTTYGLPVIIDQPSTVYGPGQKGDSDSGWFTWFIKAALTNQPIALAGDGNQSRDVLYIDDFVQLLIDQIENFDLYRGQTYEVGGGLRNEVSLNRLLDVLGYHNVYKTPRLISDLDRVVTDNSPVTSINGWQPTTPWNRGYLSTQEWLRG